MTDRSELALQLTDAIVAAKAAAAWPRRGAARRAARAPPGRPRHRGPARLEHRPGGPLAPGIQAAAGRETDRRRALRGLHVCVSLCITLRAGHVAGSRERLL